MPTITSTGVGSGLDVNSIVTQLMNLEQRPLTLLQKAAGTMQTRLSAFGSLKSQIASLGDIAGKLSSPLNWNPLQTASTDSASVSASVSTAGAAGKHRVEVTQLAQSQSLASGSYAATTTVVGTGTLTIEIGTTAAGVFTPKSGSAAVPVVIDSSKQTLAGVRDAINAAGAGVSASIVTSGGASRLVLRGEDGAEQSLRITSADDDGTSTNASGLSALAWDPAAAVGAGKNLSQTQPAQDALYTLDGLSLNSKSNTLADVVPGLTLTLSKVTTAPVDVTVSVQSVAVRKNVNDFVNAYNGLNALLKAQTLADPGGAGRGALQADPTATALLSSMRSALFGTVTGATSPSSLSAAGIELQRDGTLTVNDTKMTALLQTPAKLAQLFTQAQTGADTTTRGFGLRFKQWAATLTDDGGIIAARTDGYSRSLTLNQKSQDAQSEKLTRTEARLRAQYQKLDSQMTNLNGQMAQMKSALGLT